MAPPSAKAELDRVNALWPAGAPTAAGERPKVQAMSRAYSTIPVLLTGNSRGCSWFLWSIRGTNVVHVRRTSVWLPDSGGQHHFPICGANTTFPLRSAAIGANTTVRVPADRRDLS
ncbi:hypothetical protein GCM10009660_07810 [Catellatospora bangladeshensis]